ncbi:hypothetical protein ARMSODRAFT_429371 [Armillaria solidipes]|uniref:Uncharacterized protein n=1 Tax=Armillaria solidipes TaxID=1076256 RepID=A0A2H3B401_9AGAR|nr:hypothetical protein ARMSODRAFT_429371 [Armillaria solidipes]
MSKIVKKVFTEYIYPAAVIFDENPIGTFTFLVATASLSWEWIPFALVASVITIYAYHVFSRNIQEEAVSEAKLEKIESIYRKLNSFVFDQHFFFQVRVEDVEAFQFCLDAIEQRALVTQQQADLLFSAAKQAPATSEKLAQIAFDLGMLDTQIRGVMRGYSRLKTRLQSYAPEQQLEAAKHWVADINRTSPVPVDIVDEDTNLGAVERDDE